MKTKLQGWIGVNIKEKAKLLGINMSHVSENAIREEIKRIEKEKSEVPRR